MRRILRFVSCSIAATMVDDDECEDLMSNLNSGYHFESACGNMKKPRKRLALLLILAKEVWILIVYLSCPLKHDILIRY